ncbi:MAG: hypothetical protein HY080_02535, partial [Gammaproteobacteria bacterium]|nr:hypothetical protein [Gammaproteobacteria bacterium]
MLARLHKEPAPHAPSASWFFGNAANDANGNLPHRNKTLLTTASTDPTTLRGMTLAYDSLNRLTTLNGSTTYAYNALNQRTSKTVNGITTYFVYGLGGELLAETTAGNDTDYVYLDGTPLAQVRSNQV